MHRSLRLSARSTAGTEFDFPNVRAVEEPSKDKVQAIFDLRAAVEEKTLAQVAADRDDTATARELLLDATLKVEAKTQDAIEICHACERPHAMDLPHERHARVGESRENVVEVDFRPQVERRKSSEES